MRYMCALLGRAFVVGFLGAATAALGAQGITRSISLSWLTIKASLYTTHSAGLVLGEHFSTNDPTHHSVACISPVLDVDYVLENSRGGVVPLGTESAFEPVMGAGPAPTGATDDCRRIKVSAAAVAAPIKKLFPSLSAGRYILRITLAPREFGKSAPLAPINFTYDGK